MDRKELDRRLSRGNGQYPHAVNAYDDLKDKIKGGNEELRPMLRMLNQAMFETKVGSDSFSRIGNLVIRLSIAAINYPDMEIDTGKMASMEPIVDTHDRFIELQEEYHGRESSGGNTGD